MVPSTNADSAEYLKPARFIDSSHPDVIAFARQHAAQLGNDVDKAVALYYAVRDGFRYDPYRIDLDPEALTASALVARGYGFCIPKAVLLAAAARAEGIPSRLGFADVKNHLTTEKLRRLMQTDVFAFHGYTELHLDGRWVKATPAFNSSLCERFDVEPLGFDGRNDAMLQQLDRKGNRYMEYIRDHGTFADLPYAQMLEAFRSYYPVLLAQRGTEGGGSDFETDAGREHAS